MKNNFSLLRTFKFSHSSYHYEIKFISNPFYSTNFIKKNFSRDFHYEKDIENKLKEKFENKNQKNMGNVSSQYADIRFDVRINILKSLIIFEFFL